jgi:hypothetical protein
MKALSERALRLSALRLSALRLSAPTAERADGCVRSAGNAMSALSTRAQRESTLSVRPARYAVKALSESLYRLSHKRTGGNQGHLTGRCSERPSR